MSQTPPQEPTIHAQSVDDDQQSPGSWAALVLMLIGGVAFVATLLLAISSPSPSLIMVVCACGLFTVLAALRFLRGSLSEADEAVTARLRQAVVISKRSSHSVPDGEEVLLETRQHPLVLFWWILGGIALQALTAWLVLHEQNNLALTVWLAGMIPLGIRVWLWERDRICVSKQRLFATRGILKIRRLTLPLPKLTDATVVTPALSNVLAGLRIIKVRYGTLYVESAGQDQALKRLKFVPCIEQVGKTILSNLK